MSAADALKGARARIDVLGNLRLTMPDGSVLNCGRVAGLDGRAGTDGLSGAAGKDGRDGAPGRDGIDGKDGVDGKHGNAGRNGVDGKDGAPGLNGKDGLHGAHGRDGVNGADGSIGPVPRHEVDPPEQPHRIRFEIERAADKAVRWGPWIDLKKLLPKVMPGKGGGYGGWERTDLLQRVLAVINPNPMDGYAVANEDISDANVKYTGYTKVGADTWYVIKTDHTALNNVQMTYATPGNNPTIPSYKDAVNGAWAKHATLAYSLPENVAIG